MFFSTKTKKWEANVKSELSWEKQMSDLTSIFIPAKEILSNAWNLESAVKMGNVEFDDTYLDIIAAAKIDISRGVDSSVRKKYIDILQKISSGKVTLQDDRFYLKQGNQAKLEFNLVAEGLRKIALLWQLIKNGTLEKGSVLFWDEPEANINPIHIPVLAELLIMLESEGVQIFISTHDYFLAKYIEVKRNKESKVQYISFYEDKDNKTVQYEVEKEFEMLEHNTIMETFRQLYKEEIGVILK
jgi:predicted ATPase